MTNCLFTKPEHKATVTYQFFDELNQVWTGDADVTELLHDRRLSHTCEVSENIYSTAQSNKVRFIFNYEVPTMINRFILAGISAISGLSFSVYADNSEIPTTPLVENFAQTPHLNGSKTENQVINIAGAVSAITYLLLIDNSDVDDDPEFRNFVDNSDFSSTFENWVETQVGINVIDISGGNLRAEVLSNGNFIQVRNEFRETIESGGITAELTFDIESMITTAGNDTTTVFEVSVHQFTRDPNGEFISELARISLPRGDFGEPLDTARSLVFNMPETPTNVFDTFFYVEVTAGTVSGEFVLDNIQVRRHNGGQATHLNQPFDISMLMAGSDGYQPADNFQGRGSFSNVLVYSGTQSESTKTRRRLNSSRVDVVQFIKKSDSESQQFENFVRYSLPSDGLVFWQRNSSSFDFTQCFIGYVTISDRTNDYENLNSISATIEEAITWL